MQYFAIACVFVLGLVGTVMIITMTQQSMDEQAINKYMQSRGSAEIPRTWRSEMGKGI